MGGLLGHLFNDVGSDQKFVELSCCFQFSVPFVSSVVKKNALKNKVLRVSGTENTYFLSGEGCGMSVKGPSDLNLREELWRSN